VDEYGTERTLTSPLRLSRCEWPCSLGMAYMPVGKSMGLVAEEGEDSWMGFKVYMMAENDLSENTNLNTKGEVYFLIFLLVTNFLVESNQKKRISHFNSPKM